MAKVHEAIKFYKEHKDLKPEGVAEVNETGRKLAEGGRGGIGARGGRTGRRGGAVMDIQVAKVGVVSCSGEEIPEGHPVPPGLPESAG